MNIEKKEKYKNSFILKMKNLFNNQDNINTLTQEQFSKLFHIRKFLLPNEVIPGIPVFDDEGRFQKFAPHFEEPLFPLIFPDLISGSYFGKTKHREEDYYFSFMNFTYQNCNFLSRDFIKSTAIENDIHNLATSLKKLELFFWASNNLNGFDIQRFVITEIEYIFSVCQSLYDLLQSIIYSIWEQVKLTDMSLKKSLHKESFAKMLGNIEQGRTFGLTNELICYYKSQEPFFYNINKFRNAIHHEGFTPADIIYITSKGFAVSASLEQFALFGNEVWKKETFENNTLAPLKPILAFVIKNTIEAMNEFENTIRKIIPFPEDIAPGYKVFIRRPHLDELKKLDMYIDSDIWYENSSVKLKNENNKNGTF